MHAASHGIRFEDMGLAVRVAVSGEAASEEERIQAGKTLAELRNTPMFEQLTSGDAKREERIGSLIELHLAAYRKRKHRTANRRQKPYRTLLHKRYCLTNKVKRT